MITIITSKNKMVTIQPLFEIRLVCLLRDLFVLRLVLNDFRLYASQRCCLRCDGAGAVLCYFSFLISGFLCCDFLGVMRHGCLLSIVSGVLVRRIF